MTGRTDPILRTDKIGRRYGGLVAVADLDMEIRPGEILGLIGPNGAGKSTTFNLISGFVKPSQGRLFMDGVDVTGEAPHRMCRRGMVRTFQHGSLMPSMTVRENILIGAVGALRGKVRSQRAARAEHAAHALGLTHCLDEVSGNLPHGLQRLVSIAIAYAAQPRILCLDEPLTGLNQTELANVLDVLRHIRDESGCAILLVEHNMKAVMQICERIIVLHHGQMLASGAPQDIRTNEQVIAAYLGKRHAQ